MFSRQTKWRSSPCQQICLEFPLYVSQDVESFSAWRVTHSLRQSLQSQRESRAPTKCQTWGQPLSSHLILSYMGTLRWTCRLHRQTQPSSAEGPRGHTESQNNWKGKKSTIKGTQKNFTHILCTFRFSVSALKGKSETSLICSNSILWLLGGVRNPSQIFWLIVFCLSWLFLFLLH